MSVCACISAKGCSCTWLCAGKLDLYVAAAGFHPRTVLPCVVDVGTDNVALRSDPLYMGLDCPRVKGEAFFEVCCTCCPACSLMASMSGMLMI